MARHTVGLERGDAFDYRLFHSALGNSAHVDLDGLTVVGGDPVQLEAVGELFLAAGRDLRLAIIAENEKRAASDLVRGDDTSALMRSVQQQKAQRDALKEARKSA